MREFWKSMSSAVAALGLEHRHKPTPAAQPEGQTEPVGEPPTGPTTATATFQAGLVIPKLHAVKVLPTLKVQKPERKHTGPKMPMTITLRGELRFHEKWKKKTEACGFSNAIQTWNEGYDKYGTVVYNGRAPDELHPGIYIVAEGTAEKGVWEGSGKLASLELERTYKLKGWGDDPRIDYFHFWCSPYAKNSRYIAARIERGDNDQLDNHHQEHKISKRIAWKPRIWFEVNGEKCGLGKSWDNPKTSTFEIVAVYYWGKPTGWPSGLKDVLEWFEDIPVIGWLEEKLNDFGNWLEDLF